MFRSPDTGTTPPLSSLVASCFAVTADLHFDVARSRTPAQEIIGQINQAKPDGVLLIGDTATADSTGLEECLALFAPAAHRLFVPGNHELWARRQPRPAEGLLGDELRTRVTAAGWHWLPGAPFRVGRCAIVGSLGWYDYGFAEARLGLPRRFYEAKLSPGAARLLGRQDLAPDVADIPEQSREFYARWNDGRFIHGIVDDEAFLATRLAELSADLTAVRGASQVVAAIHVAPVAELLPRVPLEGPIPADRLPLAFTRAYLGSSRLGDALGEFPNITHVYCGHTHIHRDASTSSQVRINIGSDYLRKRFEIVQLSD